MTTRTTELEATAPQLPAPFTEEDKEELRGFVTSSRSENTRRAYASDWASFTAWCQKAGRCSMPADPETVAVYISKQSRRLKVSTIQRHLAAIGQAHKAAQMADP